MPELRPPPPRDEADLLSRAEALAGLPLARIALRFGARVPADLRHDKGWIGNLLETALGATAKSRAEPDFPHLGVEMKSIPVTADGRVLESTYVCSAPLDGSLATSWEESWVRHKLARVLWVPIVGDPGTAPGDRVVGSPLPWSPSLEDDAAMREDWQSLAEALALGEIWRVDAREGRVLQVRPKAASRSDHTWTLGEDAEWVRETPRGFYLRARFTTEILHRHYRV